MPRYRGTGNIGTDLARKDSHYLARHGLGSYHVPYQAELYTSFIMSIYQQADTTICGIYGKELEVGTPICGIQVYLYAVLTNCGTGSYHDYYQPPKFQAKSITRT